MHVNHLMKSRRLALGLSQAKLAKMLGYPSCQFISNIENNRAKVPKSKLRRLCRGLLIDKTKLINAYQQDSLDEILVLLRAK